MKSAIKVFLVLQLVLIYLALNFGLISAASEESIAVSENVISASNVSERTIEEMEAMDALIPDDVVEVPFRSTLDQYSALKNSINTNALMLLSNGREASHGPLAPPTLKGINFEGVNQTTAGGWRPPDTHGAIGKSNFVEVTNSHIDMYAKASPNTLQKSISLASFFGYTTTSLFDPRCVYDRLWKRFIVISSSFVDANNIQRCCIAISKTSNPTGAWWIYTLSIGSNTWFFDYPQLGMDQDAIIITANIFNLNTGGYLGAEVFAISKAQIYNGLGFSVPVFTGLEGTLAPPIVLDNNAKAFLVAAPGGTGMTTVYKYTMEKAGRAGVTLAGPASITVSSYSVPPNASQPGTTATLDTLDARFVNASTQVGDSLFQIHSIDIGGAVLRWYEFNTTTDTVTKTANFWTSGTSNDWNASIAANDAKDVYVTWSSTDATNNLNAQVRFGGRKAADAVGMGPGTLLFQSATFYTGFRWGDYSAVSVDPSASNRAWIVNEKINSNTVWGTRIARIGF